MAKKAELSQKHWDALKLLEDGRLSLKEVAEQTGFSSSTMYALYEGAANMRETGMLFKMEVDKITKKSMDCIKPLLVDNKKIALRMINDFLKRKMCLDYQSDEDVEMIITVLNAMGRLSPMVEINNNTQFNQFKGLSEEDQVHELNRITSLIRGTYLGGGVSAPSRGRAAKVSE